MESLKQNPSVSRLPLRIGSGMLGITLLALIYFFQRTSLSHSIASVFYLDLSKLHPYFIFIANKTLRLILNDFACFLLIFAVFVDRKYLQVAFYVFLIELLIILPVYFFLKLSLEGDSEISSPLLSQVHRMIVNPTLMVLLMFGFYFQRRTTTRY